MTVAEWLFEVMSKLGDAGVDSPRRDALVLLEDTLGKDRSWVLTHPEHLIRGQSLEILNELIVRRMKREPLAYIRGKAWFYKRFFEVSPDVMIPRPESEAFVKLLKELYSSTQHAARSTQKIVDVGTGSGCLAITVKLELPKTEVIAIDSSRPALEIARRNAKKHKVDIKFLHGSLLRPLTAYRLPLTAYRLPLTAYRLPLTAIVANLPYVPDNLITSPEIGREPAEALFSGTDGMDHYREFWHQIANNSQIIRTKYVLTESLVNQHAEMEEHSNKAGYTLVKTEVLVQLFRR